MSREMVNSGVPWIGEIPKGWKVSRLKHLATDKDSLIIDGDWIESTVIEASGIRYLTTGNVGDGIFKEQGQGYISRETFDALNCTMVYAGDLVFSRLNYPMGRSCIIPDTYERCVVAVDNVIFRPNKDVSKRFLMYVSMCTGFQNENALIARGATMQRMSRSQLVRVFVPIPDTVTQQKIASFLDRKCAEIDEMIALQEKIVEELKAYKQSVITEAVIKGLNPDVPMKDSGIEWIGEIPEHWEVRRLKYIGKAENGLTYTPSDVCDASEGVLVLRSSNVQNGKLAFDDNVYVRSAPDYLMVKKGDIIICSRNGSASLVGKSAVIDDDITASFGAFMMRFRSHHNYKYIHFLLTATIGHYKQLFTTTTINQLTIGVVNNIAMPFIENKEEQQHIADYLDAQCKEIDNLISIKLSKVDSLKEYKKSIIYEYVTGKKEVIE